MSNSSLDDLGPLELSTRLIDESRSDVRPNRVTNELSELDDDLAIVESFSHSVVFRTGDGLVAFDSSGPQTGAAVVGAIRSWSEERVDTLVYTHGHVDHVGGSGPLLADAEARGHYKPRVVSHEAVKERFDRYRYTNGFNLNINDRQFGHGRVQKALQFAGEVDAPERHFLPADVAEPTETYQTATSLTVGDTEFQLHHARGETDDHTWAWIPERKAICSGDLMVWVFPNAGNPQKVQRYPGEWAASLRDMVELEPELLLPAHGLPIAGKHRIAEVLTTIASTLEELVTTVVDMMNAGASLNDIVHTAKVPDEVLALPYLRPTYDEPEFVVRNIWRLYGGWWGGDPAELKPAPADELAAEWSQLAGGADKLAARAQELAAQGELRLACHLIETAAVAEPESQMIHELRREIYGLRRSAEASLMARGVFAGAIKESDAVLDPSAETSDG